MPSGVYVRNKALRPHTFLVCKHCGETFGPVDRLARKFCSIKCKAIAQSTGKRVFRKTITKARSAQSLVRYHVCAGNLIKAEACEHCRQKGKPLEAAHKDYDLPLDILWLCRSCHRRYDKAQPKGATVIVKRWETLTGQKAERQSA